MKTNFGGKFSINSTTGDVYLHNALDREKEPLFHLEVVAVDVGRWKINETGEGNKYVLTIFRLSKAVQYWHIECYGSR